MAQHAANPTFGEPLRRASSKQAAGSLIETIVERSVVAQRAIEHWGEEQVDTLLRSLSVAVAQNARALAVAAVAETGMGNVRDKTLKNEIASTGTWAQLAGQVGRGEIGYDGERRVAEIASPVGVIFGLVPATHPVATFIFKVLIALKGRNAIILSPSRRARQVSQQVGRLVQQVLRTAGAPDHLVQWLDDASGRETSVALMSHERVGLVLATGGPALVRAAYRSGTPAIGVGPGNAPTLISADAEPEYVARSVVLSKSFDNGLICGAENHLVVEAAARAPLVAGLIRHGAAVLTADESARFRGAAVNADTQRFLPHVIGRDAATLAKWAQIERPYEIQLLVAPTDSVAAENYLAGEKLAPVLSMFTVANGSEGIDVCRALLEIDGAGHTAIIHSGNAELTRRFTAEIPASRILVNSPATQGLLGVTTGLEGSFMLGCGSWGRTSTTKSITYRDLLNIKRVAFNKPARA